MVEVANGLGQHRYHLSNAEFSMFQKYSYLDWLQVFISLALSKISICLFLLRLSSFNRLEILLYALIAFLVLSTIPLTLLMALQCSPVDKYWSSEVAGHCFSKNAVEKIVIVQGGESSFSITPAIHSQAYNSSRALSSYLTGDLAVFSVVVDFIGAAFPVVLLWNAKISIRDKIALCLLMGLGVMLVFSRFIPAYFPLGANLTVAPQYCGGMYCQDLTLMADQILRCDL